MAAGIDRVEEEEISRMEEGVESNKREYDYHKGFFSSKDIIIILQKVNYIC